MMCKDVLENRILKYFNSLEIQKDVEKVLKYMEEIQNLAVWLRKFSDPKIFTTSIVPLVQMIEDALILNGYKFFTSKAEYKIHKDQNYHPYSFLSQPYFFMYLNIVFSNISKFIDKENKKTEIKIHGDYHFSFIDIYFFDEKCDQIYEHQESILNISKKIQNTAYFEVRKEFEKINLSLKLNCFENNTFLECHPKTNHVLKSKNANKKIKNSVLVVDDEEDIRKLMRQFLTQSSLKVLEGEDGLDALKYFQKESPFYAMDDIAVIVCDVRMPRMTGSHFLVSLRESKITTPFIFFSSNLVPEKDDKFNGDDVYFIPKDAGLNELKKMILKFM
jgi:CheY-like chemotaxis protein